MVQAAAAEGYEREAGTYARSRPEYPAAAIADLFAAMGVSSGDPAVELGAGTGIFTRQLRAAGLGVTAVEPVAAMREHLRDVLPADRICAATAEATGLPDDCASVIFAATAWHWFDPAPALAEVRRLLRPGAAGLGLIWNVYDESVPWLAELSGLSDRLRPAGAASGMTGVWRGYFDGLAGWEPLRRASYPNPWPTDPDGIIGRVMSSSVIAALPDAGKPAVREEARQILIRHGLGGQTTVDLPYVTRTYWTRPVAS
jgi:SAM-dependent methyltransferase